MKVDKINCDYLISIGEITSSVKYLVRDQYCGYSSTSVAKLVKKRFDFVSYTDRRGMHCKFRANDIWNGYFMENMNLRKALEGFRINTLDELLIRTKMWC